MSFWSWLVGGSKVVNDVFDKDSGLLVKAGSFINDLSLTDAERQKAYTEFYRQSLEENTERSKTRRAVAIRWLDLQIMLIRLVIVGIIYDFACNRLNQYEGFILTDKLAEVAFSPLLWTITSGIGAFFFGTHLLRAHKQK